MICRNCGLQNPSGFAFCGSCGQALETPAQPDPSNMDDTLVTPSLAPRAVHHSLSQAVPVVPARPEPGASNRQSVVCRNCGRANAASRSVCQQCGRRLVLAPAARYQQSRQRDNGVGGGFLASGASVLMLLAALGAGGLLLTVVFLGAGAQPAASPIDIMSPAAVLSPTPTTTATPAPSPTQEPTAPPTVAPVATPDPATEPPASEPPASQPPASPSATATTPPVAGLECATSSAQTAWLNLTRDEARERVPADSTWCVHEVYVVPYFGSGRIRLVVDGEPVAEVNHRSSSSQSEYRIPFATPLVIAEGSRLSYQYRCRTADCAAAIQVGYDPLAAP